MVWSEPFTWIQQSASARIVTRPGTAPALAAGAEAGVAAAVCVGGGCGVATGWDGAAGWGDAAGAGAGVGGGAVDELPRGIVVSSAPCDKAGPGAEGACAGAGAAAGTLAAGGIAGAADGAAGDGSGAGPGDGVSAGGVEPAAAPKRLGAGADGEPCDSDGVLSLFGGVEACRCGGATKVDAGGVACSEAGTAATRSGRLRSSVEM